MASKRLYLIKKLNIKFKYCVQGDKSDVFLEAKLAKILLQFLNFRKHTVDFTRKFQSSVMSFSTYQVWWEFEWYFENYFD